jgi:hypothetical protein
MGHPSFVWCRRDLVSKSVPTEALKAMGGLHLHLQEAQGLKPNFFESFAARLKSCPDTKPTF